MLFPTIDFAIFICLVFPTGWLLMPRTEGRSLLPWKLFMIAASYVFYGWWDVSLVWLLALVTVLAQTGAIAVSKAERAARKRAAVAAAVAVVLTPLLWFKYYGFLAMATGDALGLFGVSSPLPLMQVLLPVGISFYTFMAVSYVVDVYRNDHPVAGWIDLSLYLAFFPHLVAGPIVRPGELIPQFRDRQDPSSIDVGHAARLIFRGLFKKVVISSYLAGAIVDPVFADPGGYGTLDVLFAIYGYAVVIYSDFSGYTDIAIGIAELLGFRFPVNFDAPYTATSLQDFWRRWHITLSRWLRDYLYIPLGGSKGSRVLTYRNILITMILGGLWHGAGWTFIVWGAIHGAGQAIGHFRRARQGAPDNPPVWRRAGARLVTFHVVCLGWVFFRAENLDGAFAILARLVNGTSTAASLLTPGVIAVIAAAIAAQYLQKIPRSAVVTGWLWDRFGSLDPLTRGALAALILFAITTLGPEGVAPFIYFRF